MHTQNGDTSPESGALARPTPSGATPLTELGNAAHARGQQGLLDGPQLRLAEHGQLPRLGCALRLAMQVQAVGQA